MSSSAAVSPRRCIICRTAYSAGERFCPRDGGAIVDDEAGDPAIGRTVDGRYLVRKLLGRGGMGAVYLADHVGLGKVVAIKFLARDGRGSDAIARFRREARAAARVAHEHVVQIYDVGITDDGIDFLVMEYVPGGDLRQLLDAGPLAPPRAVAIARQMLAGLDAIHRAGIVHRDIKPANILLAGGRDFVKLTDFGIARAHDLGGAITHTGQMIGTPQFMAPEQFTADVVDPRADIYAAGITLYAMLAGHLPFAASTMERVATMHFNDPPPPIPLVSPALSDAVTRALAKSPADRFPDATAFSAALDAAAGTPSPTRIPRAPRRWPWLAAALVVVAAGGIAIGWGVTHDPPRAAVVADAAPIAPADARVAEVAAATPDATAPPDAAPPVRPVRRRPALTCLCFPDSPPSLSLCVAKGAPKCRCAASSGGVRLCPTPFELCENCPKVAGRYKCEDTTCDPTYGTKPCSDPAYRDYHLLGHQADDACEGYPKARGSQLTQGKQYCNYCASDKRFAFHGQDGERCKGVRPDTGAPAVGHLDSCTATPPTEK